MNKYVTPVRFWKQFFSHRIRLKNKHSSRRAPYRKVLVINELRPSNTISKFTFITKTTHMEPDCWLRIDNMLCQSPTPASLNKLQASKLQQYRSELICHWLYDMEWFYNKKMNHVRKCSSSLYTGCNVHESYTFCLINMIRGQMGKIWVVEYRAISFFFSPHPQTSLILRNANILISLVKCNVFIWRANFHHHRIQFVALAIIRRGREPGKLLSDCNVQMFTNHNSTI
jgi:hypothetical protein